MRYLSLVIAFFQSKPYFVKENTPAMHDVGVKDITVNFLQLGYREHSLLWNRIGQEYRPSVLYRIAVIPIEDSERREEVAEVHNIQ